jgi:hypothetical protein
MPNKQNRRLYLLIDRKLPTLLSNKQSQQRK